MRASWARAAWGGPADKGYTTERRHGCREEFADTSNSFSQKISELDIQYERSRATGSATRRERA